MVTNLSDYGSSVTNTLVTRKINNEEGTGINPNGIEIVTSNNKISILANDDLDIGCTTGDVNLIDTGINYNNNVFLNPSNLVLNTKSSGGIYLNKQDMSTDTTGDWKLRVDSSNNLIIENYNGVSWDLKLQLESN